MKKMNKKGFTIVELVIVIAVIAILAAILIPTFANVVDKANVAKVQAELKNAKTQYIMEASDDKNYNPDLELVFKHTNSKGKIVYYLEEDGTFIPAEGVNYEDNVPKDGVYFVPLQYKSATDEWLFAEFGEGTVGVLAYEGALVESYGGFVEIRDTSYSGNYGNAVPPIWKATDSGFEVTGELDYHSLSNATNNPLGFLNTEHWFLSFTIEKPENVEIVNDSYIKINTTTWRGTPGATEGNLLTEFSDNGSFDCIWGLEPGENLKVTIDWDGEGVLFAPQTYVVDCSKLVFPTSSN